MYALVRYVEIITDNRLHVIPVEDILNFDPADEFDFDNKKTYTATWHDEKDEANNGQYVIQILRLAGRLAPTKEEMELKMLSKRTSIPQINASDVETDSEEAAAAKKTAKQELKKNKIDKAASKKRQFQAVLKRHTAHMLNANAAAIAKPSTSKASKKPRHEVDSASDLDESLVPPEKLHKALKESQY
ncbi:unnamed protein product [Ixodes persulcatus]